VFFSNKNQYLYRYPYVSDTFLLNGVDVSRAKIVVNKEGSEKQYAQILSDKSLELCGRRPTIVTDAEVVEGDDLIIIGPSAHVPAFMQTEWDAAKQTTEGQFSYYINNTENVVWINTDVLEGYSAINREIIPRIQSNQTAILSFDTGLVTVPEIFSVMSFNVFVSQFNDARVQRVVDTILENAPSVFGVQEASIAWMTVLKSKLNNLYASVGVGRDWGGLGEHSAIFYRTDKFRLIQSGTKWLSDTPNEEGTYCTYIDPETGTTHRANFPRIMTYAILERKSDGVRFLYVNTHLDHNGNNSHEIAEGVRQRQIEILIAEIKKLGDLPTIVTGDFNVSPEASAYTTMIGAGFLDSSHIAKEGEIKPTYNNLQNDYAGAIIDYIFVSPELKDAVDTYTVCPSKRDGQWISDHNAIIATLTLPTPEVKE
ncbi:MAG: endonuclease/exonuclease/phosphatase family protein, partial [Clostridia bacterium]|nr:endonuclease/exonuclease/phosphatase family protein [Clostridia bacterium]